MTFKVWIIFLVFLIKFFFFNNKFVAFFQSNLTKWTKQGVMVASGKAFFDEVNSAASNGVTINFTSSFFINVSWKDCKTFKYDSLFLDCNSEV